MKATPGQVLKYTLLPGFLPRIHAFVTSGFVHAAYLMAVVYQAIRLLPPNHAYLNPQNIGKFGIRHVMAEAANRLVFKKQNIDQIIVFFTILGGIVILGLQIVLFALALIAEKPAVASAYSDVFGVETAAPYNSGQQDLAFIILDRVFGLVNIYDSCIANTGLNCQDLDGNDIYTPDAYPYPFHTALHQLLEMYSRGIFVVSVILILYYVITIVGETAASGTPFGQRVNSAWTPLRLIAFFALLVPLNTGGNNAGLNGAQIITFWTAKFGSNFATNTWLRFNDTLTTTYLGEAESLIATPNMPEMSELVRFMFLAKTCQIAEQFAYKYTDTDNIRAYIVRENQAADYQLFPNGGNNHLVLQGTDFDTAIAFSNYGNVTIRFGEYNPDRHDSFMGFVRPWCGQIKVHISDLDDGPASGAKGAAEAYYELVKSIWFDDVDLKDHAECAVRRTMQEGQEPECVFQLSKDFAEQRISFHQQNMADQIEIFIEDQKNNDDLSPDVSDPLLSKGWAGAAIWYNRLAELNGDMTTAIFNVPQPDKYPYVMEYIKKVKQATSENADPAEAFNPILAEGIEIDYARHKDAHIAATLNYAYRFWEGENQDSIIDSSYDEPTGNIVIDTINLIFGTSGIFNMYKNTDIHPLAQLSAVGRGLMEATIRNVGLGAVGIGASKIFPDWIGKLSGVGGNFLMTMGMATISLGFVLYYVLPFMPFIYFLFALSGWIKSIFEAVVAMPLWALAHIRIDGDGLPGPAASNGYYLLLEILLRPVLILFGLLASITIFAALVEVLNDIFDIVVSNLTGFDHQAEQEGGMDTVYDFLRSPIDQFFYTAMYVIICYMIGIGCFKMIDMLPNNIMRWMGVTVASFQENAGDPAGQVLQKTYSGTVLATGQVRGGALAALG